MSTEAKKKRLHFPKIDGRFEIVTQEDFARIKSKELGRTIHPTLVANAIRNGSLNYTLPLPTDPIRNFFEAWEGNFLQKKNLLFYVVMDSKAVALKFDRCKRADFIPTPFAFPKYNGLDIIDIPEFIYRKEKQCQKIGIDSRFSEKTDPSLFSYYEKRNDLTIIVPDTFLAQRVKRFIVWDEKAVNLGIKPYKTKKNAKISD